MRPTDHDERMARAQLALDGISVGDSFGERFFAQPDTAAARIAARLMPPAPWSWTDDTAMALSVVEVLAARGTIDPYLLADAFARRYEADPRRGYGGGAHVILQSIVDGTPWIEAAHSVFDGLGSMGNGGGMRVAPVGGYFAGDLSRVIEEARASALPTHAHPDGQAGAIAVAVAASLAASQVAPSTLLERVYAATPDGPTRDVLAKARLLPLTADVQAAVELLGNGSQVCACDTVPFALWCAARHLDGFEEAMWTTVAGLGDRDTTCAIVGGIVALSVGAGGIPPAFLAAREPLA